MSIEFTWDPAKAEENRRKHGVGFDTAKAVFADPFAVSDMERIENGEYRWQTIGLVNGCVMLLVAHTIADDDTIERIRIISARRATSREVKRYERERR